MQGRKYMGIVGGSLLLAIGLDVFLVPARIAPGGISTIGTVLFYLFRVPLSVTTLVLNAVLFLLGYKFLEKSILLKTVLGILFSAFFLEVVSILPVYTEDALLATLAGGLCAGVGIGLAVREEASTGGSDFLAIMLQRFFPHISVSVWMLLIDTLIILSAGLVFGSLTTVLYSALALFVSMKATDFVLSFGDRAKSVYILSARTEEMAKALQESLGRGITGIYSRGMYAAKNGWMLLCVVSPKELPRLVHLVREMDSGAFMIVSEAREVLGEGFKTATVYDKMHYKNKDK